MWTISVIITTYNRKLSIIRCIESVLDQSYPDFELIVVDDGSTDNSTDSIESNFDNELILLIQENKGVSAARNLGVKHSSGNWLAFLDSDDLWHTEKLFKQIDYLKKKR